MRQSCTRTLTDALHMPARPQYVGGTQAHVVVGWRIIVEGGVEPGVPLLDVPKAATDVLARNRRVGRRDAGYVRAGGGGISRRASSS